MIDEKVILQVLAEQQEEIKSYKPQKWVARKEYHQVDTWGITTKADADRKTRRPI